MNPKSELPLWTKQVARLMLGLTFSIHYGQAMSHPSPLVLFSPVQGLILDRGIPVAGAEILQKIEWSDTPTKNPQYQTSSDSKGHFSFPLVQRSQGIYRWIPGQWVMRQTLTIRYQGIDHLAWLHTKMSPALNSEMEGKPLNLVCDLSNTPDFEGTHYGICRAH